MKRAEKKHEQEIDKRIAANAEPTKYRIGGTWGDAVHWNDDNHAFDLEADRCIYGWKDRRPRVGDLLLSEMKSGRVGVYVIRSVEYCLNPSDMFFAKVRAKGYADELGIDPNPSPLRSFIHEALLAGLGPYIARP